jgi:hypothetical protein
MKLLVFCLEKKLFEEKLFHFKSNNWHSHDYQITITQITPRKYEIEFEAIGPNTENYTREIAF